MPGDDNNDKSSPFLTQNTEHSPPFLIPAPLPLAPILRWEGGITAALKISKTFVGPLSLDNDGSVPSRINEPSIRSKLEPYPLPI